MGEEELRKGERKSKADGGDGEGESLRKFIERERDIGRQRIKVRERTRY